jgi:dTDP-4-amino-4,6-dideoxygalactose transaminase
LSNKVNYWTGHEGRYFEKEFAFWCGTQHAVALANGTVALEIALKILDIGVGDEVIVTPRTFIASASCVVAAGAVPVFADVDTKSQNITAETIRAVITSRTKAVICVHLAGWPCDMDDIMALATEEELFVIEDCAQAHGAKYKGRSVGSIGHLGAWSFCQDKIMSTGGEGGMLTTNNADLWAKAWAYKDHGKSYEAVYNKQHSPGFRWLHESFGTNWRMTEIQAAIGRIQLRRMSDWHEKRRQNAKAILTVAREFSALQVPEVPHYIEHAWYKCYFFLCPDRFFPGWDRDRVIEEIVGRGVPCYSGSCPEVYLEKAFADTDWRPEERLPVARKLGDRSLMFLIHPSLTAKEIEKTCTVLVDVMKISCR